VKNREKFDERNIFDRKETKRREKYERKENEK